MEKGDFFLILDENIKRATFKVEAVFTSKGLKRIPTERGETGDIIAITGNDSIAIGQTLADPIDPTGFPKMEVEEPTLNGISLTKYIAICRERKYVRHPYLPS